MFSFTGKTVCVHNRETWPCDNGKGNQTNYAEFNFSLLRKRNVRNDSIKYKLWLCLGCIYVLKFRK